MAPAALRELPVRAQDGFELTGWYAPANGRALTIVYFHGNGDSLASAAAPYIAAGCGFLVAEYRGYGGMPRVGEKTTAPKLKAGGASDANADWGGAADEDGHEPAPPRCFFLANA